MSIGLKGWLREEYSTTRPLYRISGTCIILWFYSYYLLALSFSLHFPIELHRTLAFALLSSLFLSNSLAIPPVHLANPIPSPRVSLSLLFRPCTGWREKFLRDCHRWIPHLRFFIFLLFSCIVFHLLRRWNFSKEPNRCLKFLNRLTRGRVRSDSDFMVLDMVMVDVIFQITLTVTFIIWSFSWAF